MKKNRRKESEFFLKAVIDALSDSDVTVVSFEEYEKIDGKYWMLHRPQNVVQSGDIWRFLL